MRFLCLVALAACAVDDTPKLLMKDLPLPQQGSVMLVNRQPLEAGRVLDINVVFGPPNGRAAMFYALGGDFGPGDCPPFLGGECLDITGTADFFMLPQLDASGALTLTTTLPATVPAGDLAMQVLLLDTVTNTFTGTNPAVVEVLPPTANCPTIGPFEPNDDAVGAPSVLPGDSAAGHLCEGDRVDWYTIDLPAGAILVVDASFSDAEGDLDLWLFDQPQRNSTSEFIANSIASSASTSNDESVVWTAAQSGTYYIAMELYSDAGVSPGNDYTIDFAVAIP